MEFLEIFMKHICPAFGAVIALLMFASPLKAVLAANRTKDIGVSVKVTVVAARASHLKTAAVVAAYKGAVIAQRTYDAYRG